MNEAEHLMARTSERRIFGDWRDLQPGRRWVLAKRLAAELGISPELMNGLVRSRDVEGGCFIGKTGAGVYFVYREEADRLRRAGTNRP